LSSWDRTPIACTRFCERDDLEHVGGTKDPDIEAIVELGPDLVVVDAEENRKEDHEALLKNGISVHVMHIRSLEDVNPSLSELANRIGARWPVATYEKPMPERLRAFIPIWRRPWIALGTPTYGASVLAHLGIATVFNQSGPYPEVDLDQVRTRRPEIVLAPSEPYPFTERQRKELESVAPTVFVDGKDLFWWGARSEDALLRLAEQFKRF
jgi:ABC-type Fe3+-hydroxamate transport system substrate-binding protein